MQTVTWIAKRSGVDLDCALTAEVRRTVRSEALKFKRGAVVLDGQGVIPLENPKITPFRNERLRAGTGDVC